MVLLPRTRAWLEQWRQMRQYRRLMRVMNKKATCRICGIEAPVIGVWGHQLADDECSAQMGDHIDRVRRLFMFQMMGIPIPPETVAHVIGCVDIDEISNDIEIRAMVIHALAMTPGELMPADSPLMNSLETWEDAKISKADFLEMKNDMTDQQFEDWKRNPLKPWKEDDSLPNWREWDNEAGV